MSTISFDEYPAARPRAVALRIAVIAAVAAAASAFGAGYALAPELDAPVRATVIDRETPGHTWDTAAAEAGELKRQPAPAATPLRLRRSR